jgi:hypothetical protein
MLWLEEITRNHDQQVLWSEEIKLKRPNPLKQLREYFQAQAKPAKPTPAQLARDYGSKRKGKVRWGLTQGRLYLMGVGALLVLLWGLGRISNPGLGFFWGNDPLETDLAPDAGASTSVPSMELSASSTDGVGSNPDASATDASATDASATNTSESSPPLYLIPLEKMPLSWRSG